MDPEEQKHRLLNIVEAARHYENLLANDDFLKFKAGIVARMDSIIDQIKSVDRTQEGWKYRVCDAVIAWQEANLMYTNTFILAQKSAEHARTQLAELSKAPDQPS